MIIFLYFILDYKITDYHKNIVNNITNKKHNFTKRVAILITGQIREDSILCLKSQMHNIINPLNADVFCEFDNNINEHEKMKIINLLNPKKILWKTHNIEIKDDVNNIIRNVVIMYKRKYICNKLKKKYESRNHFKYDIVIRCRPDLFIKEQIPEKIINNIEKNTLYYPVINNFDFITSYFGVNDQIYISDSDTMNIIANLYNILLDKKQELSYNVIPEKMLFDYITTAHIQSIKYEQKFILIQYIIDFTDYEKTLKGLSKFLNKYKIYNPYVILVKSGCKIVPSTLN